MTTSENSRLAHIQFAFRPPSTQDSLDRLCKAIPNSQCGSLQIFCEFVHPNANGQSRKILSGIGPATKLDDYNLVIFRGISNLVKSQKLFEQFGPASEMGSAREPNKSAQPLARIIWSPTASMRPSKEKNIFFMSHLYELAETPKTIHVVQHNKTETDHFRDCAQRSTREKLPHVTMKQRSLTFKETSSQGQRVRTQDRGGSLSCGLLTI